MSTEAHSLVIIPLETQHEPQVSRFQCLEELSYVEIFKESCTQDHKSRNCVPKRILRSKQLGYIRWRNILPEGYQVSKKKGWKGLVGHPGDRGRCGIFFSRFYLPHFIFESFSFCHFISCHFILILFFENEFFLQIGNSKCPQIRVDHSEYSQIVSHLERNHELE